MTREEMTRALWELLTFGGLGLRWWQRAYLLALTGVLTVMFLIGLAA